MTAGSRALAAPAVALLTAGTLAFEIFLVRVFAIAQYHHFAYMAIGVAMLGVGASGTLMSLRRLPPDEAVPRWFAWAGALTALTLVAAPALALRIRVDATQLAWQPREWLPLGGVYLLCALPFAAGALAVLLALTLERERPGRVYGLSFLGSGLGAALAVIGMWLTPPERGLAVPALVAAAGAVAAAWSTQGVRICRVTVVIAAAAALAALARPPWRIEVTRYKELPQVETYPDARRVAERSSPLGWVVAARAPAFRYAPGLSLAYRGAFPAQTALFVDGHIAGAVVAADAAGARALLDWLPSALPYAVRRPERVLVVGAGGDLDVENALAHGARHVTAVEINPDLVRLSRRAQRGDSVTWVVGDARSYVARSRERFDVIAIGPGGAYGAAAAGVHALDQDFLHTTEALAQFLVRLEEEGVLAVTRWLTVPPRAAVRTILTVAAALRRVRPEAVRHGLVVARGWGTATVLAKPSGFTPGEIAALEAWTRDRRFDLDWYPGLRAPVSGFNLLDEPTLFRAAAAASSGGGEAADFAAAYPFAVAAVSDARPYPHHFVRLRDLPTLLRRSRGEWLPFAEWGAIALVATLGQAAALGAMLLALPAILGRHRAGELRLRRVLPYFGAIGFAYLCAEIAAIQELGLMLGHPVYAVAAALTAFLVCSGLGSACSDRLAARRGARVGALLATILAVYAAGLLPLVHLMQGAPLLLRAAASILVLALPATFMGMLFPLGLRTLVGPHRGGLPWAWAANGFASVVAAPLAALIALELGAPALFLFAAAAYGVASLIFAVAGRSPG